MRRVCQAYSRGRTGHNEDTWYSGCVGASTLDAPYSYTWLVRQFLDVDVLEPQFVAVVLKLDRALGGKRFALVPVVGQGRLIDDFFTIEDHRYLVALHDNVERVPFAHRFVRLF